MGLTSGTLPLYMTAEYYWQGNGLDIKLIYQISDIKNDLFFNTPSHI